MRLCPNRCAFSLKVAQYSQELGVILVLCTEHKNTQGKLSCFSIGNKIMMIRIDRLCISGVV